MSTLKDNERISNELRIVWQFDIEMNVGKIRMVKQWHIIAANADLARAAYDKVWRSDKTVVLKSYAALHVIDAEVTR
ncbi:hypothetical protein [Bradyrhizobium lablabi]|uniref:hypothetical protein n=1 Tax=Bradyrhizobium lablabi TaxID=722472 RepID=UPI001BADB840|nr:hypothetical protein [Bradyrhizobium lablabi]MBR0693631.1 hypothetical protein [Bradyrhizobium lablabi]